MGYATEVSVEFNPRWYQTIRRHILPQMEHIANDAREYINSPDGAPVGDTDDPHRGELKAASFVRVDPETSSVELGVDLAKAKWGLYVIKGTVNMHANDFVARAADHALQMQRARSAL